MKTLTAIIVSGIFALSATACTCNSGLFGGKTVKASRNYVTKNIKVDNFTGLNLAGSPNVTYTQKAGKPEVEVYTSDNIVDLLDINVVNNTLNIKFKKGVSVSYNKLEIRVSSETLNNISVAGSGNVELANGLKTDNLKVSVAGSGDIDADNITCTGNLNVSVAGSGDIEGSNITCANLTASIAGSGDLKLDNVSAAGTEASVSGSGTAILTGTSQEADYHFQLIILLIKRQPRIRIDALQLFRSGFGNINLIARSKITPLCASVEPCRHSFRLQQKFIAFQTDGTVRIPFRRTDGESDFDPTFPAKSICRTVKYISGIRLLCNHRDSQEKHPDCE